MFSIFFSAFVSIKHYNYILLTIISLIILEIIIFCSKISLWKKRVQKILNHYRKKIEVYFSIKEINEFGSSIMGTKKRPYSTIYIFSSK